MGWTWYHATNYKRGNVDRKAEIDALWNDNGGRTEVVKSTVKGSVYYGAIKSKEDGKVFAVVYKTGTDSKDYFNFGYKDMDETMGPCEAECPVSILDLLSPTDHEWALEWRERCRKNAVKSKKKRSLSTLKEGSVIQFVYPYEYSTYFKKGEVITMEKRCVCRYIRNGKDKSTYRWCSGMVYMPQTRIPEDFEIVKEVA